MGSSFGEVVKSWVGIANGKFFCAANGAKLPCFIDVGSWCLSCWHLKTYCRTKQLVQWPD